MATKINEGTEFAIPLKNIIGLIAATAIAVWAYFGIVERIGHLELKSMQAATKIEHSYNWTNNFKPPEAVADSVKRVRKMELQIKELEMRIKFLESKN